MPVLPTQNPTLADVAKRLDPDGKIAMIVEILNQTNEVLEGHTSTSAMPSIRVAVH